VGKGGCRGTSKERVNDQIKEGKWRKEEHMKSAQKLRVSVSLEEWGERKEDGKKKGGKTQ